MPWLVGLLVVWVLWDPPTALAWGPSTHIELGRTLLSTLAPGLGAVAGLLTKYARDFLYGNVAADVIQAKKLAEAKKHCHNWPIGLNLLDKAENDHVRAFALGYLCHLAADCVAHNKFVPRQMMLSQSRTTFSHLYWEMRADAMIGRPSWQEMRSVVTDHWADHDELMETYLEMPLFSFGWNKRVFRRISLASSARSWRRGVKIWQVFSRFPLPAEMMGKYHAECLSRMRSVLAKGAHSPVVNEDPVGSVSFANARVTRKLLRQMASAGILRPQVLREAVAHLAPSNWPGETHRTRHAS
ncbi:MAG: zinc dependent phospholipase C family protein [Phycisphaerae bacterium]|nr:zinc dependent phospholipase C family protein [Phycisphaerae bacterium]